MSIISALPYSFTNGTTADANQVNSDLAQIVANVNANAAALAGATFTGAVDTTATTLTVAPATAAGHALQAGQSMGKNKIINGDFKVNQKAFTSPQTLVAGVPSTGAGYGHDMWRGGASGCTYSFTNANLGLSSVATITAYSLITAIESANIDATTYVLSWTGTAVARVGVNGAAPSGNFAVSPIYITTAVIGTQTSVEFACSNAVGTGSPTASGSGTLSLVQMEEGVYKTTYERKLYEQVLRECQRYLQFINGLMALTTNATVLQTSFIFPPMRSAPTATVASTIMTTNGTSNYTSGTGLVVQSATSSSWFGQITGNSGMTLALPQAMTSGSIQLSAQI